MNKKTSTLAVTALLMAGLTTGNIIFDHSDSVDFRTPIDMSHSNAEIQNFFHNPCGPGEAVTDINDDGQLICGEIEDNNLSEVLAEGQNAWGQPITNLSRLEFEETEGEGLAIGDAETEIVGLQVGATAVGGKSVADAYGSAFGLESNASLSASAIGHLATASGQGSMVVGSQADSEGDRAVSVGTGARSYNDESIALGPQSETSANGAVAIGHNSFAPNSYEATFGNLDGDEMNVNVTGNLTVHGSCAGCGGGADQNLVEVLEEGDSAEGENIEGMGEASFEEDIIIDSQVGSNNHHDVVIGGGASSGLGFTKVAVGRSASASYNSATALGPFSDAGGSGAYATAVGSASGASDTDSVAVGRDSSATAEYSSAIGSYSSADSDYSLGVGYESSASAEGAVAIGHNSFAPNSYEATFGNLDGEELDVNVTGDLTVHGDIEKEAYPISYSTGHTAWDSNISSEEINRWELQSGEYMRINRVEISEKGGGSSNVNVIVTDNDGSSWFATPGSPDTDAGETSVGETVQVVMNNNEDVEVEASITVSGEVRPD